MNKNVIERAMKAKAEREGKVYEYTDASTMHPIESIKGRTDCNALNQGMKVSVNSTCTGHAKEAIKVHYGVNYDAETAFTDFLNYEDMQDCNSADFYRMKNRELESICVHLGVKKSGKKSEKVHSIMNGLSDILSGITWLTDIDLSGDDALNYVLENSLHEIITFMIVRHHAFSPAKIVRDDAGNIITMLWFTDKDGCQILMNNHDDPYWNDVRQEVALSLLESEEVITVKNGYPKLTKGQWADCSRHISKFFRSTRTQYAGIDSREEESTFLTIHTVDESGKDTYTDKIVKRGKKSDSSYLQALACNTSKERLEKLANDSFLISFFRWLAVSKKYSKYYFPMFHYFCGKIDGLTNQAIMEKWDISRRILDKSVILIKEAYSEYGTYISKVNESFVDGCTYYKSDESSSGSYGFRYDLSGGIASGNILSCGCKYIPIQSIIDSNNERIRTEKVYRDREIKDAESKVQKASGKLEYRKESGYIIVSRDGKDIERYRIVKAV